MEEGVMVGGAMMLPTKNIVQNAMEADNVSMLVKAVSEAGLVDALSASAPDKKLTVFAPTNDAFAKIPEEALSAVLADKTKLTSILTYHVIEGTKAWMAADIPEGDTMMVKTLNGQEIKITKKDGIVLINDSAKVEIADIVSSNGVTHIIDTVLMPS